MGDLDANIAVGFNLSGFLVELHFIGGHGHQICRDRRMTAEGYYRSILLGDAVSL